VIPTALLMVLVFFFWGFRFWKVFNLWKWHSKKSSILNCSILEKCSDLKIFSDFEKYSILKIVHF
jgi:hypothetical protein